MFNNIIMKFFFVYLHLEKNVWFSAWSTNMQSFSSFGVDLKKLLASQKRDRTGSRAESSTLFTQLKLDSLRSVLIK